MTGTSAAKPMGLMGIARRHARISSRMAADMVCNARFSTWVTAMHFLLCGLQRSGTHKAYAPDAQERHKQAAQDM